MPSDNRDTMISAGSKEQIRVAVLSDLHIEHETVRWARCSACGALMVSRRRGEGDRCACGVGAILTEGGARTLHQAEWEALPSPGWGDACRTAGVDLVLLAGDIHSGTSGIVWAAEEFRGLQVVYVAGNHEAYGFTIDTLVPALRSTAAQTENVTFLECETAVFEIRGRRIRVYGCMLFTDYAANVAPDAGPMNRQGTVAHAMWHAERGINDHQWIGLNENGAMRLFTPADALAIHHASVAWLDQALAEADPDETTIVMTHHGVGLESESEEYRGGTFSPAFVSDLRALWLRRSPHLVVHGHTHHSCAYQVGDTPVVSHQRGYPHEPQASGFMPKIVTL